MNLEYMTLEELSKAKNFLTTKALPVAEGHDNALKSPRDEKLISEVNGHIDILNKEINKREERNRLLRANLPDLG